jgi:hypothetical protein
LWRYLPKLLSVLIPVLGYFRRFLLWPWTFWINS